MLFRYKYQYQLLLIIPALGLSGCSQFDAQEKPKYQVHVGVEESAVIRFSGKGSGIGMIPQHHHGANGHCHRV